MRTIKFRGKDIETDEWLYGDLFQPLGRFPSIINTEPDINGKVAYIQTSVKKDTVEQFTGLLDKNGKEIYEGDIVKNKEVGGYGLEYIGVVRYYKEDCRFGIDLTATNKFAKRCLFSVGECSFNDGYCTIKYYNEYEVLGNIFDNPELLKSL